jgi:hypothetical protein
MIRDKSPGAGFSGTRTSLQWSFSGARTRLQQCGWGVCSSPTEFLRKSREILEPVAKSWESPAGNSGKFWKFCIIKRHRSRVHQSRPEKRQYLWHVTQPCARVTVSCNRAGRESHHEGQRRPAKASEGQRKASEGQRKASEGWVPELADLGARDITKDSVP